MKLRPTRSPQQLFVCCICGSQETSKFFSQCLHTVCNDCIDKVTVSNEFFCDKCNKASDKLITNGALNKTNFEDITPNCIWCAEGGETNLSQGHCKQCDQWLCAECIKGHNRMPPFRSHTVNVVGDCGDRGLKCEIHPHESLELFCETCGVLTCRDCQLSVHRDHGGHRWVKEKAELLRPGLLASICSLEAQLELLKTFASTTEQAPMALLASVDAVKSAYRRSMGDFVQAIDRNKETFDSELDKTAQAHIDKLATVYDVMQRLLERIDYTLRLSHCLVDNGSKDPASLVQLAACLEDRLEGLIKQVSVVASGDMEETVTIKDTEGELESVTGWLESAASRVVFLPNRSPEELAKYISSTWWTLDPDTADLSLKRPYKEMDSSSGLDGDDLDNTESAVNTVVGSGGCAVCHSPGLLVICSCCQRAFHPACHLPRLDPNALHSHHWTCTVCPETAIQVAKSPSTSLRRIRDVGDSAIFTTIAKSSTWTREQFECGCRILLSLLCHPEACCFTSFTVCPICSSSLAAENTSVTDADTDRGLCGVFHGLTRLRNRLEASETVAGRPIEVWIRDIDTFTADACVWSKEFGASAITEPFDKAARNLRDALDFCVESHYPEFFNI